MPVLNEGRHDWEFGITEANGKLSRDVVTIAAAAPAMVAGTVLGKITASGKYAPYNSANTDGTQTAVAILATAVADLAADQQALVIARHAEVKKNALTGYNAAADTGLRAVGIVAR